MTCPHSLHCGPALGVVPGCGVGRLFGYRRKGSSAMTATAWPSATPPTHSPVLITEKAALAIQTER